MEGVMKKLMRFMIWLLLFVISSTPAAYSTAVARKGPSGRISGQILDSKTSKPIFGAKAILYLNHKAVSQSFYTEENGNFVISSVPSGIFDVKIIHKYYSDQLLRKITVKDTGTTSLKQIRAIPRPDQKELIRSDSIQESTRPKPEQKISKGIAVIAGQVWEKYTKEPIIGARIRLIQDGKPTGYGAISDLNGNFATKMLPIGVYDVEISYIGYTRQIVKHVKVQAGLLSIIGTIKMVEELIQGDTV
jgi:hypothetical protein